MKTPKQAKLLLGRNCVYPIKTIHYKTQQVTLQEKEKVFNTVSINDVEFDLSGMNGKQINKFYKKFQTVKVHEIKIAPEYYDAVKSGVKKAEYRYNDRGYKVNDILVLCEYKDGKYTGRYLCVRITHILQGVYGIPEKWAILSIKAYKRKLKK